MKKSFFNKEQASAYLTGTVVRFKNKPIYIYSISYKEDTDKLLVQCAYLPDIDKTFWIGIDDEDFDMTPVPLGFLSTYKKPEVITGWCSRIPQRRWKQGLAPQHFMMLPPAGYRPYWDKNQIFISEELKKTITNDYPDYEEALKISKKVGAPISFHRDFALDAKNLFYKGYNTTVGIVADNKPILDEDKDFLKEAFAEALNGKEDHRTL